MSDVLPTIGFIGLGIMGAAMAENLLRADYPMIVDERHAEVTAKFVAAGARTAPTPRLIAQRADVVITMLPDSPDVESVALGAEGLRAGFRRGATYIDMSTISPAVSRRVAKELAADGVTMLDAPVSGGQRGAIDGALSIMVGGTKPTFDAMLSILQTLGKNIVHVGESGAGQVTKACNQIVVGITIEAVAEALALAEASGVDGAKVREALLGGFAQSRVLDVHGQRMLAREFAPGFKAKLHRKDLAIAESAAREAGLDLPVSRIVLDLMTELATRDGELDHSALRTLISA